MKEKEKYEKPTMAEVAIEPSSIIASSGNTETFEIYETVYDESDWD